MLSRLQNKEAQDSSESTQFIQFATLTASVRNLSHPFDSLATYCEVAKIERLMCQYGEKKGELCQA